MRRYGSVIYIYSAGLSMYSVAQELARCTAHMKAFISDLHVLRRGYDEVASYCPPRIPLARLPIGPYLAPHCRPQEHLHRHGLHTRHYRHAGPRSG